MGEYESRGGVGVALEGEDTYTGGGDVGKVGESGAYEKTEEVAAPAKAAVDADVVLEGVEGTEEGVETAAACCLLAFVSDAVRSEGFRVRCDWLEWRWSVLGPLTADVAVKEEEEEEVTEVVAGAGAWSSLSRCSEPEIFRWR